MDVSADPVIDVEPGVFKTENIVNSTITATSIIVVKMETEPAQSVRVLNMGGTRESRLGQMLKQGRSIIILCKNSRAGISAERAVEMGNRFADAELYLDWLDTSLEMTPDIRRRSKVDVVLQRMADPINNVPENAANKAKVLLDKYEADNWGQDLVADEDSNEPSVSPSLPAASPAQAVPTEAPTIGVIQLPPANDPIFGERGIMYGVVIDMSSGRRTYRLRADIPRKSAKVYGHNDIALGTWYPYQINALFWGAHGARMGGIAGSVTTGAYSIVVSSTYEDLDTDNGDTLFYSGSNSHDNANPERPATPSQGTKALHASVETRNPVRVLRSGGASGVSSRNQYLPPCGLRYDGLYRVLYARHRTNGNGGLYEQFKLERLPGQTPLAELRRNSPTVDQIQLRGRV